MEVRAPVRNGAFPQGSAVGLFFSSGVDSSYSLAKNVMQASGPDEVVTDLLVVHGFDLAVGSSQDAVYSEMVSNAQEVARRLGKRVLPVATNLKNLMSDCGVPWGSHGHGAALGSIGLALGGMFRKVVIAATTTYTNLYPTGSHPLLDPLWSSETTKFEHDGCEAGRVEKVRSIAASAVGLGKLRVCWERDSPHYNCGVCSKCLRTMLALRVAGVSHECETLPAEIDAELVRKIPMINEEEIFFLDSLAAQLGAADGDGELRAALLEALEGWNAFFDRLTRARKHINNLVPLSDSFIFVDEDTVREKLGTGRHCMRFLQRNGHYAGVPPDDRTAVQELDRHIAAGAKFIAFWQAGFWFLDYYSELRERLRSQYQCLVEDDSLILFDLRRGTATQTLSLPEEH